MPTPTPHAKHLALAVAAAAAGVLSASAAFASNPLEYPDNGSASFSRGGAWLGVANEPIATHYNPAGLATQGSGFSVEQQLNFNTVFEKPYNLKRVRGVTRLL